MFVSHPTDESSRRITPGKTNKVYIAESFKTSCFGKVLVLLWNGWTWASGKKDVGEWQNWILSSAPFREIDANRAFAPRFVVDKKTQMFEGSDCRKFYVAFGRSKLLWQSVGPALERLDVGEWQKDVGEWQKLPDWILAQRLFAKLTQIELSHLGLSLTKNADVGAEVRLQCQELKKMIEQDSRACAF